MNQRAFIRSDMKSGDPVRTVADPVTIRRMANILKHLKVHGGYIVRSEKAEGTDWILVVDGRASDIGEVRDSSGNLISADPLDRLATYDSMAGFDYLLGRDSTSTIGWVPVADSLGTADKVLARDTSGAMGWADPPVSVPDSTTIITAPTYVLGRDSTGTVGWVLTTDTCA